MLAGLGAGEALEGALRSRMESALGSIPSDVRLHHDAAAARVASQENARALVVGRDVVFGANMYRPGSFPSDVLLAHELAHVQQQADVTGPATASEVALERDASHAAAHAALAFLGGPAAETRLSSGLRLQRCTVDYRSDMSDDELFAAVVGNIDSWSFDREAALEAMRDTDTATARQVIERLKLEPHDEHGNYYRYLLHLMQEDLSREDFGAFQAMLSDPDMGGTVALGGEAASLRDELLRLTTPARDRTPSMAPPPSPIPAILRLMRESPAPRLDAALADLRQRYHPVHGNVLNAVSAFVRARGTDTQYRQFIGLLHSRGLPAALRQSDAQLELVVEEERQLLAEGAESDLTDAQMRALFASRALETAFTMLRGSEAQIVGVLDRSAGGGGAGPQLDADVDRAVAILNRFFDPDIPASVSFEDFRRSRQAATDTPLDERSLRRTFNRQRQIELYRLGARRHIPLVQRIESFDRSIAEHREWLGRTHIVRQSPFLGPGPALTEAQRLRDEHARRSRELAPDGAAIRPAGWAASSAARA